MSCRSVITIYDRNTAAVIGTAVDLAAISYPKIDSYPVIQIQNFVFHPEFGSNHRVFMFIKASPILESTVGPFDPTALRGYTIIAEIQTPIGAGGVYQADPTTFKVVYEFQDPVPTSATDSANLGGLLAFGPDGHLYVGTGDFGIPTGMALEALPALQHAETASGSFCGFYKLILAQHSMRGQSPTHWMLA